MVRAWVPRRSTPRIGPLGLDSNTTGLRCRDFALRLVQCSDYHRTSNRASLTGAKGDTATDRETMPENEAPSGCTVLRELERGDLPGSSQNCSVEPIMVRGESPAAAASSRPGGVRWTRLRAGKTDPASNGIRLLRRFADGKAAAGHESDDLGQLEAEIALLREDNARLRLEQAQSPDAGRLIESLRSASEGRVKGDPCAAENVGDEVWQHFTETMLLRNTLIDICAELGQVAVNLQSGRLGAELNAAPPDPRVRMHGC